MLRDTGGIKPPARKKNKVHLTLAEREEIRVSLSAKKSIRAIAKSLDRSPSTISREVQRNRGRRYYKAVDANNRAGRMSKRPKQCLLSANSELRTVVLEKLELNWSPEQISGWLKRVFSRRHSMRVSAETIYKTIYFRSRAALNHVLVKHLRRGHSLRHSKKHSRRGERGTINIVDGISIHERAKTIDARKTLGHWEGDLITGSLIRQYFPKKTCLAQHTQEALDKVAAQLNSRPRKTLDFRTPKQLIEKSVALTS